MIVQRHRTSMPAAIVALVALPLLFPTAGAAGSNTVYNFLRNDVGARAAALAGSFVTVSNDPDALFYNPASITTLDQPRGSLGYFKHVLDIHAGSLSYAQEIPDIGYVGGGILYTYYGSFTETDETGTELGTFGAGDLALAVVYGNIIEENLTYGATLKFVYSSIAGYSSTGVAADAGILYRIPESRVSLGASLRNLGTQLSSYLDSKEDLPLDVAVGVSVIPKGLPLLLNVGLHRLADETDSFGDRFRAFTIGGEFTLSQVLQLRVGYDNAKRRDLKVGTSAGLAGFSAGVGLTIAAYRVDYALSSLGAVANLHRISISRGF